MNNTNEIVGCGHIIKKYYILRCKGTVTYTTGRRRSIRNDKRKRTGIGNSNLNNKKRR